MRLVVAGGHVIDAGRDIARPADVIAVDGLIEDVVAPGDSYDDADVVDASGLIVSPGFVDLHTHLREPGDVAKETVATGTAAAARGGFTTVCAMPNTNPPMDAPETVGYLKSLIERDARVRVEIIGAITKRLGADELTDMHALADAGAIAFSNDGLPVARASVMRRALELANDIGAPIINHAEEPSLVGKGVMHEGEIAFGLGLPGVPAEAEAAMTARDIELAALTDARLHIPHLSTAKALRHLERAKADGLNITAEATPHHLRLTDRWVTGAFGEIGDGLDLRAYDANARVNPPLRTQADVDALTEALRLGVIDAVATDHAPHALLDKETMFDAASPGISGLETAFGLVAQLVHEDKITLGALIERLTYAPAQIINRDLGTFQKGYSADIALIDMNREWVVDSRRFASKGRNTPLDGFKLKGRVVKTIYRGKVVYDESADD